jgi:hypothetical protein
MAELTTQTLQQQFGGCMTAIQIILAPLIASHDSREMILDRIRQIQEQSAGNTDVGPAAAGIFVKHLLAQVEQEIAAMNRSD